jgi:hypothetical protein
MNELSFIRICKVLLLVGASTLAAMGTEKGTLRVGAARVDITPPEDAALPMSGYAGRKQGFKAIHDHIFARAIVLDDGTTQAALVAWELVAVPNSVWAAVSQHIAKEVGIRPEYLILAAVHDHGAPSLAGGYGQTEPQTAVYTAKVEDAAVEAVRKARANLQPGRMGIRMQRASVNINRRELTPDRGWWLGYNENGPSDKTVTVLKFEDLNGKPIALYINYPVHAVVMGPENYQITGDLAGATSRFVEQYYLGKYHLRGDAGPRLKISPEEKVEGDGVVAVWTSGAAGDQNPVSVASGEDFTLVDALGKILGEAAVRAASGVKTSTRAKIWAMQQVATCPGRRVEEGPRPRKDYKFEDADPVNIRLSLIMVSEFRWLAFCTIYLKPSFSIGCDDFWSVAIFQ